MIEVPSAAVMVDHFAREVGVPEPRDERSRSSTRSRSTATSQLARRTWPRRSTRPILRLITKVIQAGQDFGRPVSLCGAMASDPLAALLLARPRPPRLLDGGGGDPGDQGDAPARDGRRGRGGRGGGARLRDGRRRSMLRRRLVRAGPLRPAHGGAPRGERRAGCGGADACSAGRVRGGAALAACAVALGLCAAGCEEGAADRGLVGQVHLTPCSTRRTSTRGSSRYNLQLGQVDAGSASARRPRSRTSAAPRACPISSGASAPVVARASPRRRRLLPRAPIFNFYSGEAEIRALGAMGVDAMIVANQRVRPRRAEPRYPAPAERRLPRPRGELPARGSRAARRLSARRHPAAVHGLRP